jgi:phospholipase C
VAGHCANGAELREVDRRTFLKRAAMIGGAAAVGPRIPNAFGAPDLASKVTGTVANVEGFARSLVNQPASRSPVDTIVVLMMENRSFDHYFGWLPSDEQYMEAGRSRYGAGFSVDGRLDLAYPDPATGELVDVYHLPTHHGEDDPFRGCGHPDPGHGPVQGRAQRDGGFLAVDSGNDAYALGYYLADDLPTYAPLARHFTVFDRYHCSLLSSTYPNRLYLMAAQTDGAMDPPLPVAQLGFDYPSIYDRLLRAGVSCANYTTDLPTSLFFGPRSLPVIRPIAGFFADAALGTLPHVTFVDPGFMSGWRTDDHPHGDMRVAQRFVHNIVRALHDSPQWRRSALFITYDEWGGFFDHVAPPLLPDAHASPVDLDNFGQAGFRLPVLAVSPYARPGYVDHTLYDHTSILRFIEWRFLGAPATGPGGSGWWLTERDRRANNIGAALVSTAQADDFHPDPQPAIPLGSIPCKGQWFQDVPVLGDLENQLLPGTSEHRDTTSQLERAYEAGFFDRMGYRVAPSMTLRELVGQ